MIKKNVVVAALFAFALSACGTTTSTAPSSIPVAEFPVTVGTGETAVTINAKPQAIISLSPSATEDLFAIGAGSQVIAVDDQSTYPLEAPHSKLSGYTPNVEAITAMHPDLVVISNDIDNLAASLKAANIPVLIEAAPSDLAGAEAQIIELGRATGNSDRAVITKATMEHEISAALNLLSKSAKSVSIYHELDNTFYSITSDTFVGQLYKMAGLTNIADAAPGASSGYPQLSAEYIVKSNPALIFLADGNCCGQTAATVAMRPGFASLDAVKTPGAIVLLDDDIASRWGPRTPELLHKIVMAVNAIEGK